MEPTSQCFLAGALGGDLGRILYLIRYLSARTATAIKLPEYQEPGSR
jgi:hypothetical protein